MSTPGSHPVVRVGASATALWTSVIGLALLFAPEETSGAIGAGVNAGFLVQLLGAALLGLAAMTWIARGSLLGGIYGKAVVAGNQTHLAIGALLLVKHGLESGMAAALFWALSVVYVASAVFFTYLTFAGPGPPRQR